MMMQTFDNAERILLKEFDEIIQKGGFSQADVDNMYKIVDIIKDMCEITEKKNETEYGYSGRMNGMMPYDSRYYNIHSYRGGNSYRNNGNYNMDGRYSRTDGKEHMIENLYGMMDQASTDAERNAIQDCINRLKN